MRMPSVPILHDFVMGEDEWRVEDVIGRTSFFRRVADAVVVNDCQGQKINRAHCAWSGAAPASSTSKGNECGSVDRASTVPVLHAVPPDGSALAP